tara:strand:+ start:6047 stop:7585 length:1539 start_codon:yes stop_codon:yes gene_type:complete
MIAGQDISDSNFSILLNTIPFPKTIYNISFLMISIVFVKTIFQIIFNYNQEKISYVITTRITVSLYDKFINSKYTDYINENYSKILRVLNQESVRIGGQLISPFITMINEIFLLTVIILFIFFYDFILGLSFCLISIILLLSFNFSVNKIVKGLGKEITEASTLRIKLISETFKGFDIVKLFNKNQAFILKFDSITKKISNAAFKNLFYLKLPKSIFELAIFIIVFIMIIVLGLSNKEDLLISYLSVSAVSIYKIIPSLNKLSNAFQGIQYFITPFKEIVDYLKTDQETLYDNFLGEFKSISYNNLSFKYDQDIILENVDFSINKNDFIGIYGPSGSGKSTFIKLLSGLLTSEKGEIIVDKNLVNPIKLRNYYSYVPQDSIILDENIFTNVSLEFNESEIDKKKILDILTKVDLFEKFKSSLNSSLGESGIKISGGQKQRIAIARALYHNKSILILDESTSNLDTKTENKIIDLLEKITEEITIIIVSHKKSSLAKCNKLFEINNRKINKIV